MHICFSNSSLPEIILRQQASSESKQASQCCETRRRCETSFIHWACSSFLWRRR